MPRIAKKPATKEQIIARLRSLSSPDSLEGMGRYGINVARAFGVSVPQLRAIARENGRDHDLAQQLWASGFHEARILASMIDDPRSVTEAQMNRWVADFDSWDICDQCCGNLFDKTEFARRKAIEWSARKDEFIKRAGFAMMAELAVHDKDAPDDEFLEFLEIIKARSDDERNFVKKAVNWALRQIGKRNPRLNKAALQIAKELYALESKASKWIAADAIRELESDAVQTRLK